MSLEQQISTVAEIRRRPDGSAYRSLPYAEQQRLAALSGSDHHAVQIAALQLDIVPEVYARNQTSLSCREQLELLRARVAIIGLGGLGGAVCEILARIGIGRLTLIDGDRFADSNLNRQLLSSTESLGHFKAEVAARRIANVNPAVICRPVPEFLTIENGLDLLDGVTIAVDCLDSIPTRLLLQDLCTSLELILVSAAIGGTSGQATVIMPGDEGLYRIYRGNEATVAGAEGRLGTLPFTAMAMAAVECAEVVAVALGRPAALRNRLLVTDLDDHSTMVIDLPERKTNGSR
ncbi:MAG: ThiF family adenylyltransferase [Desulfofustis sp.]|nr:ThiF family adenylyltransferase [Desulfofustis sp.]